MSSKGISMFTSLLCLWAGVSDAAQTVGQGTIEFRGSIVEPGCATNARSGSVVELKGCAQANRAGRQCQRSPCAAGGGQRQRALLRPAVCAGGWRR